MNQHSEDSEFDLYIGRSSRLSEQYRELGSESPPGDLDAAVLSMARAADQLRKAPVSESYIGWMAPVAFAATVILVFSVVLQIVMRTESAPAPQPATSATAIQEHRPLAARRTEFAKAEATGSVAAKSTASVREQARGAPTAERAVPAPVNYEEGVGSQAVAASSVPNGTAADARSPAERRDPRTWLAEIERLRSNGQTAAAAEQMRLFRKEFPDYPQTARPTADER